MIRAASSRRQPMLRALAVLAAALVAVTWSHGEEPRRGLRFVSGRAIRIERGSKRAWGPEQAAGAPDTPQAGDSGTAWASQSQDDQQEWLLCDYAAPIDVRSVIVHATYNPGALIKVSAFNAAGDEVIAWDGDDPTPKTSARGVSVIPVKLKFPVQRIKVTLDSQTVPGWNEIDAVGLEDSKGQQHWATKVEASSTYAAGGSATPGSAKQAYSPEQATSAPDTPGPGDQSTAWASASPDSQPEWLACQFETAQKPAEIVVYENTAPGAIVKITVFNDKQEEVVAWEGVDPTPRDQPWGVSVFPIQTDFAFNKVKLYINSQQVPGYNEVDAVGLRALNGDVQWAKSAQASSTYGIDQLTVSSLEPLVPQLPGDVEGQMTADSRKELKQLRKEVDELKALVQELTKKDRKAD